MAKPSRAEIQAALREHMRQLAVKGGKKGGKARAAKMTAEERRASALKAIRARWAKTKRTGSR